jgi:tetratricopeptide (TPR) repeat protein
MSHFVLGVVAQRAGRYEEALAEYQQAEQHKRRRRTAVVRNLHANMADCLARLGREAEAEREFRAEIETIPSSREGRVGLATLYRSQGRDAEAREVLGGLIAAEPRATADSYWTVVRTFRVLGEGPRGVPGRRALPRRPGRRQPLSRASSDSAFGRSGGLASGR